MLMRCSLSPQQRLNVLSATGNSLKAEDIEQALRGAEDDLRVQESEACRRKGKGRNYASPNFWTEQGGEWGLLASEDADLLEGNLEDEGHQCRLCLHCCPSTSELTWT